MNAAVRDLDRDESGGALIEYALVLSLVSLVALVALSGFGEALASFFVNSSTALAQTAQNAK